jgi:hypothetical protein
MRKKSDRGRGRPKGAGAFKPTAEQSNLVEMMAGIGIPERRMVSLIINPATGAAITPVTLRDRFRRELDRGLAKADVTAGSNLLKLTARSAAAAIFWAKVRLGWKETTTIEIPLDDENEYDSSRAATVDAARRIAFVLTSAGRDRAPRESRNPTPTGKKTSARTKA